MTPPTERGAAEEAGAQAAQAGPPAVPSPPAASLPAASQGRDRWWLVLAALFGGLFVLYLANGARFQGADTLGSCYSALAVLRGRGFSLDRMVGQLGPGYWYHRGVRGYVRLDEDGRDFRIKPGGEPIENHLHDIRFYATGVGVVAGQRMPIGNKEIAFVLLL